MILLEVVGRQARVIQQQAATIKELTCELEQIRAVYGLETDEKKVDDGRCTDYSRQLPGVGPTGVPDPVGHSPI